MIFPFLISLFALTPNNMYAFINKINQNQGKAAMNLYANNKSIISSRTSIKIILTSPMTITTINP